MNRILLCILTACLVGCGGGDDATPAPIHYLLFMETVAHQSEAIYVYESANDCIGAGSYRVFAFPDKYIGYSCKEV